MPKDVSGFRESMRAVQRNGFSATTPTAASSGLLEIRTLLEEFANAGTDHGTAGPVFLTGDQVKPRGHGL